MSIKEGEDQHLFAGMPRRAFLDRGAEREDPQDMLPRTSVALSHSTICPSKFGTLVRHGLRTHGQDVILLPKLGDLAGFSQWPGGGPFLQQKLDDGLRRSLGRQLNGAGQGPARSPTHHDLEIDPIRSGGCVCHHVVVPSERQGANSTSMGMAADKVRESRRCRRQTCRFHLTLTLTLTPALRRRHKSKSFPGRYWGRKAAQRVGSQGEPWSRRASYTTPSKRPLTPALSRREREPRAPWRVRVQIGSLSPCGRPFSLSLRERAGVRGL